MARINLDDDFFCDPRIKYLAQISGETIQTTQGRLINLYHYAISRTEPDQTARKIDITCAWDDTTRGCFAELLVKAELANKPDENGLYRIRGVVDAMQYLILLSATRVAGGRASAKDRKRDELGRLLSKRTVSPACAGDLSSRHPAGIQVNPGGGPAESSALYSDSDSDKRNIDQSIKEYKISQESLEEIYKLYPRKQGKKKGMEIGRREIRSPEDLAALRCAIIKYVGYIKREKKEQFIQMFSTFMGSWRDWLDDDAGTTTLTEKIAERVL